MESPEPIRASLKPETVSGFIHEVDTYQSPRCAELIKSYDKEKIAILENRITQKDDLLQQMGNLQAQSHRKLDEV